ncbi:MAG: protein kinase [Myxococcales bacterium]|nr:protein kinase [Myxococcales bacterium]
MSADLDAPTFPERVGRYELLLPIGTGGMATVYLARIPVVGNVHREVALKLMHPFLSAEGRESTVSLVEEAKLAVRIRHPNVVPVIEVGDSAQGVFLVMEYVEGDTLSGLHRAVRADGSFLPLNIAGRILVDALAGLHAAHELRDDEGVLLDLVHRDFSPQNILVGTDGVSRLTDFGVAKAAGRVNVTSSGIIKGKVAYMAPEQALGKKVDRRCDVWAAGVVAWEVLAGQRLYRQEDQVATLLRIVNEPPPRISTVRPDVPKALDDLVAQTLAMDVDERIGTADELRRRVTEAWKTVGGLADAHEVSEFVQATARPKIVARREQVSRVIRLRSSMPTLSGAVGGPTALAASDETTSAISASSVARHSQPGTDLLRERQGRRRTVLWALGGAVSIAAVAGGAWLLGRSQSRDAEPAAPAVPTLTAQPSAKADPAPSALPKLAELTVDANAPIKSLRVNGRSVPVGVPTKALRVTLEASEAGAPLELEAATEDQRKATARAPAGATAVTVSFPDPKKPSPAAPAGKVVRDSTKSPDLPGLAPTPYEK